MTFLGFQRTTSDRSKVTATKEVTNLFFPHIFLPCLLFIVVVLIFHTAAPSFIPAASFDPSLVMNFLPLFKKRLNVFQGTSS